MHKDVDETVEDFLQEQKRKMDMIMSRIQGTTGGADRSDEDAGAAANTQNNN